MIEVFIFIIVWCILYHSANTLFSSLLALPLSLSLMITTLKTICIPYLFVVFFSSSRYVMYFVAIKNLCWKIEDLFFFCCVKYVVKEEFICCTAEKMERIFCFGCQWQIYGKFDFGGNIFFNNVKQHFWVASKEFIRVSLMSIDCLQTHTHMRMINKHVGAWICMIIKDIQKNEVQHAKASFLNRPLCNVAGRQHSNWPAISTLSWYVFFFSFILCIICFFSHC